MRMKFYILALSLLVLATSVYFQMGVWLVLVCIAFCLCALAGIGVFNAGADKTGYQKWGDGSGNGTVA